MKTGADKSLASSVRSLTKGYSESMPSQPRIFLRMSRLDIENVNGTAGAIGRLELVSNPRRPEERKERRNMTNYIQLTTLVIAGACAAALMVKPALAGSPSRSHEQQGTIQSVDAQAQKLTVFDSRANATHDFTWNQGTKFSEHVKLLSHSKTIAATDLKPGEEVKISYDPSGDPALAHKVVVTRAAPAMHSEKAAIPSQT